MGKVTGSNKAIQFISVQRCTGGYILYDRASHSVLARIAVIDSVNDLVNSRLRDTIINAYYEYGKALNIYR